MIERISTRLMLELKDSTVSKLTRSSQKWYETTYIKEEASPLETHPPNALLEAGKIYTFAYDPKYADRLSFYDNRPINFILGHLPPAEGKVPNAFGINLSFIPPKIRAAILDEIRRVFGTMIIQPNMDAIRKGKINSIQKMPIEYNLAKMMLRKSGFEFALRSYIYDRMKSSPRIIDYHEWWRVALFGSKYIKKMNTLSIYWAYKKQIDKADYRVKKRGIDDYTRREKKMVLKNMTISAVKKYLDANNNVIN